MKPTVSTLYSGTEKARVRLQVSVARSDLLDLTAGDTGSDARQIRVQVGGTVIPLVVDLADGPQPLRPQAWIDADSSKRTWSFARQSVLRLSAENQPRDVVLVQEAEFSIGNYRLVAVVQDQLARTISTGTLEFSVEASASPLGTIRLAYTDPATLPLETPPEEVPVSRSKKRSKEPRALPAALPSGSILSEDSTVSENQTAWLIYSLCDLPQNEEVRQFSGWTLERTLVCNHRPSPPMAPVVAEPDPSSECIVVVDPLPSGLASGTCQTEVTLERPDSHPETRTLTFRIAAAED